MDRNKVVECFHSGDVYRSYAANGILKNLKRFIYIGIGVWALNSGLHSHVVAYKTIFFLLLGLVLFRLYQLGQPLLFLCERGIVVRRRPMTLQEMLEAYWNSDYLYIFVAYDRIVGFSDQWETLHVSASTQGSLYVVPVDLQYLNMCDKEIIIRCIEEYQQHSARYME